jgi:STE24 endopeptidase
MTLNTYAIIILAALLVEYLITVIASYLNMRSAEGELPREFADVYDAEAYARSQSYTRLRQRFRFVEETFSLAVVLVFWFAGGFPWLDGIVRGWDLGPIWTGLVFIALLLAGQGILGLPFSIYSTFAIEGRYGFNRTTMGTFILDIVKGVGLAIVLGGPLLAGVLWFFEHAGDQAWLYAWLVAVSFLLVMQLVLPTWIMPLFNKFTPLEDGELRRRIIEYARGVEFPLANIFVMDGSKRSSRSNAFFTGLGRNRRVALFDTLINRHSVEEVVAVVAHEIGHYKKRHIVQSMIISVLHLGVLLFMLQFFLSEPKLFEAFGLQTMSVYAGLIFFALLFSPVEMLMGILMQILSRRNEFQADEFAAKTTAAPLAMIDALKRLSADNLQNLTPHPFFVFIFYSHPPVLERLRALQTR